MIGKYRDSIARHEAEKADFAKKLKELSQTQAALGEETKKTAKLSKQLTSAEIEIQKQKSAVRESAAQLADLEAKRAHLADQLDEVAKKHTANAKEAADSITALLTFREVTEGQIGRDKVKMAGLEA